MADAKISALPSATLPLAGTEVLPIVQSSTTDKVTVADMLRQAGQTVTTSNPVLSLAQTWNDGAVTFTGLLFNATNTASAAASMLMDLQVGGTSQFNVTRAGAVSATSGFAAGVKALIDIGVPGLSLSSESTIAWSSTTSYFNTKDLILLREAANILGQRNTTAAQAFRLYNTYTDISNYERLNLAFSGNVAYLIVQQAGTGTSRNMVLGTQGLSTVEIITNNASRWTWTGASGHFLASTDNATDIGASGANRPRNIFVAGGVTVGSTAALITTSAALADGAGAAAGTLLNAPAAGNPTKWIPINDNGTTRYVPAW